MAARQFWRANSTSGPRRSSGVIQTRSTRRHEAVNISGAARERRNKSVKRDKERRLRGGGRKGRDGRKRSIARGPNEEESAEPEREDEAGRSRCIRGVPPPRIFLSFSVPSSTPRLPPPSPARAAGSERFISRRDTTERQVTTSNCRISGCHLSSGNGFRSSREVTRQRRRGSPEDWLG